MATRISVSPDPPVKGQELEISYDGTEEITLEIDWDPPGLTPTSVTIEFPPGKATITVPTSASSIEINDPTGGSESYSSSVLPPPE